MLRSYFQSAIKLLQRRRFFTFISLFAITFTLVILVVASALLDFVFAPQAPEKNLDRTLGVYAMGMYGERIGRSALGGYKVLNTQLRGLPGAEHVSLVRMPNATVSFIDGRRIQSWVKQTDSEFWLIYDFVFLEGKPFSKNDDQSGNRVAVINEATRDRFFGAGPAVGRTIEIDEQRFTVAGVVRNVPATRIVPFSDVWVPISTARSMDFKKEYVGDFFGVVVARDRSSFPAMKREFDARVRRVQISDPEFKELRGGLETEFESLSRLILSNRLDDSHPGQLRVLLIALMFLFMILPGVNLMNISISRMLERSGEIGVRKAFGASSLTLIGQFMIENIIVTIFGGLISLAVAQLLLTILNRSGLILYGNFHLNLRVFGYGLVISTVFGIVTSAYPAWKMSRLHPVEALRGRQS